MIQPITIGRATIYHADCLVALAQLPENSIDAVVTDPPYGLAFMGKGWDAPENIAFHPEVWRQVLRVLKPGGHLLAFGGTRTYHRLVCAIEDAGFEVRDQIGWAFGTGFPKSYDVSKAIDAKEKTGGSSPKNMRMRDMGENYRPHVLAGTDGYGDGRMSRGADTDRDYRNVPGVSDTACKWRGWGTALKPAWEPICVARKPLIGTVAENVLTHGTGALNIHECRVGTTKDVPASGRTKPRDDGWGMNGDESTGGFDPNLGRWPANLIHDGSDEVVSAFPEGSARFFYCAKASKAERAGSKHPTVKPIALMRYLCRLVTPPGGTVLDPFAGTGTTAQAAAIENFNAILIEQEAQYIKDIQARLANQAGPLFS